MPIDLLKVVFKEYGPVIALIVFYVWRDFNREKQQNKRIIEFEEFQRNELIKLVKEVLSCLMNNTEALKDFAMAAATRRCLIEERGPVHFTGEPR